jgi:hypothetical protein
MIMKKSIQEFAGRTFSDEEIEQIKWTRKTFSGLSEKELASTICETLNWVTQSGVPKYATCRRYLQILAKEGIIDLPESRGRNRNQAENRERKSTERVNQLPEVTEEITHIDAIQLEIAQAGAPLQRLRAYLKKYHMLGDDTAYGEKLYYFIKDREGRELGCMRFSAASWALEAREKWIGWTPEEKQARLFLIVNQSRYLIFPWIRVKNMASRALSLATRRIRADWLARYCYEPVLLETFVDTAYFVGTSYKAANWIRIGQTKGRGRNDRKNEYALTVKDIYMYPLRRDFRAILKGEKPYKAVNPDE